MAYLTQKMEIYYGFERHQPRATKGLLGLSETPGLGIELDETEIKDFGYVSWRQV